MSKRHRLAERWGLEGCPPTLELLEADRDGLRDQLRLGWLLTTPEALAEDDEDSEEEGLWGIVMHVISTLVSSDRASQKRF